MCGVARRLLSKGLLVVMYNMGDSTLLSSSGLMLFVVGITGSTHG